MGTFNVHFSNRVERLASELAGQLREPRGGPLAPETVVVQGRGMAVWLSRELCRALGVWATPMPYPRHFVEDVVGRVLGEDALGDPPLSESTMQWAVHALLPTLLDRPELDGVRAYLLGSVGAHPLQSADLRLSELAARIATVFDQYLTFRPDWLAAWERGDLRGVPEGDRWQPLVWKAVVERLGRPHLARVEGELLARLRAGKVAAPLPPRVSVFGISTLPPLFARVLAGLSHHVDVHLYVFAPAPLAPDALRANPPEPLAAGAFPPDDGPRLLASMGTLGRDFASVLADACRALGVTPQRHDRFETPAASTRLERVQRDLFRGGGDDVRPGARRAEPAAAASDPGGARRDADGKKAPKPALHAVQGDLFDQLAARQAEAPTRGASASVSGAEPARAADDQRPPDDGSIRIHSCHGPMREVEVLHDQLLELLTRRDARVAPEEVVVLCPDLESYAPLVEAVFARGLESPRFVPFRISDRSSRREASLIDAFLRVVSMVGGRSTAPQLVDLLVLDAVQRRFGFDAGEVDLLVEQIVQSGIRWGRDADDRARRGLPPSDTNTWRFGLRRMLLGYAMPGAGRFDFAGVVPFDEVEGSAAQSVGKLARFVRTLFGWLDALSQPRAVPEWAELLGALSSELFSVDATCARQAGRIQRAIEELAEAAADAGFEGAVDIATIRRLLERGIDAAAPDRGFLAGGVTFCAFVPMRSIPFRVVCLLGMNDGAFPRSPRPLEIDLIRNGTLPRRPGDRSPRDDDRHLFLETLCAARQQLIITYTGQSIRDNRERPPSVCVSELLEHLAEHELSGDASTSDDARDDAASLRAELRRALVVSHRLQGFSPAYFEAGDPRLFSFAREYADAANAAEGARHEPAAFLPAPLEAPELEQIRLEDLVRFFRSPASYFLNRRLGVYLRETEAEVSYREPLELDGLDRWKLGEPLTNYLLDGLSLERAEALFRGHGELPHGPTGTLLLEELAPTCQQIADAVRDARGGTALPPLQVEVGVGAHIVVGAVGNRYPAGIVEHSYSKSSAKRKLSLWIHHVAACAAGHRLPSTLICRDVGKHLYRLAPLSAERAGAALLTLVDRFLQGQREPLPFLPDTSLAFFKSREEPENALARAINKYGDPEDNNNTGEARDPHHDRAFDHRLPPFDAEYERGTLAIEQTRFAELACELYGLMSEAEAS